MTEIVTTLERNKAIARFLGYNYYPSPDRLPGWRKGDDRIPLTLMMHGTIGDRKYLCRTGKDLRFNTSWDWIIPAVQRINKQYKKDIRISFEADETCVCRMYNQDMLHDDPQLESGNYDPHIMNVFNVVSDFCIAYNKIGDMPAY